MSGPHYPDDAALAAMRAALVAADPALARLDQLVGPLSWRRRTPGFAGLVRVILGQQVSTVAADAMWDRLESGLGVVTPARLLAADTAFLRTAGFSAQKARYARGLAEAAVAGFDFDGLACLPPERAVAALTAFTGIGRWTAEVYLLMNLGATDIFPAGDIALQEAIRWIDGLPARPDARATEARAAAWAPHRSAAAHWLWALYVDVKAGVLRLPVTAR